MESKQVLLPEIPENMITMKRLGKIFNLSYGTIFNLLKKYSIKPKTTIKTSKYGRWTNLYEKHIAYEFIINLYDLRS